MGLDLGLIQAGYQIRTLVEIDRFAVDTIRQNRPSIQLMQRCGFGLVDRPIESVPTSELLEIAELDAGEVELVVGGPCCQAFSTAGQRGSLVDDRGSLFREFLRVVHEAQPRFFVMENVRGVLSAAIKHRPLAERGPAFPPLRPSEELGSAFKKIVDELAETGYHISFDLVNTADYGVPQTRERVIILGSRDGNPVSTPKPTHGRDSRSNPWVNLRVVLDELAGLPRTHTDLCQSKRRYLSLVPAGGNWRDLPARLQREALGGAFDSWGGRVGFFRRLAWDRPSPALTTRPDSKATMLCHPTELRPLAVEEYAAIQQFPKWWKFAGGIPQKYKQIGNAVPVGLGRAIGCELQLAKRRRPNQELCGIVRCANEALLTRMANRPRTILNPVRMRPDSDPDAAAAWTQKRGRSRKSYLTAVST